MNVWAATIDRLAFHSQEDRRHWPLTTLDAAEGVADRLNEWVRLSKPCKKQFKPRGRAVQLKKFELLDSRVCVAAPSVVVEDPLARALTETEIAELEFQTSLVS